ncbi:GH25 family lysozyme [Dactylosporangium sp. CA-139066]|uniref:GH25 family lysozyme n=1 Tax=Dactylosporangium sp. CA-139066 TaxID=3239930 RepID=UPI003D8E3709
MTGIDVASYQGNVNWTTVASAGTSFAYAKATEGTSYVNPYFHSQYTGAKGAGLYAGAYVFARPDSANSVAQADYFIDHAEFANDGKTLPVMLDLEWPYQSGGSYVAPYPCYGISTTAMVSWIRSFVNEVQVRTGRQTLIYTNVNWWNPCTGNSAAFSDQLLDIAHYSSTSPGTLPPGWSHWTVWQYSDSGALPGDQDVFNGTVDDLARFAGASGRGSYSGDSKADLLFVDTAGAGDISEYPNLSPGNWGTTTKVGSGWAGVDPNSVYFADMNGDGRTDLLQLTGDSIRYFPNLSPGNWGTTTTIGSGWTGVDPKTLYFADMNGDGKADLLQLTGDNIRYFPNLSPGNWGTTTTIGSGWTGVDPKTLYFADMNGDGKADLLQLTGDNIRYFPNLSPGNWGTTTTIGSGWTGVNPKTLYFADMNGDGKTDLLQYNTTTHLISYYPNLSPGNWGTTTTIGSGWTTNPDNLHFA